MVNARDLVLFGSAIAALMQRIHGFDNVALNHTAWQSTTEPSLSESLTRAKNAVDGKREDAFHVGSCTHTQAGSNPWLIVDLEKLYLISTVILVNRDDCCQERLHDFTVDVAMEMASNKSFGKFRTFFSNPGQAAGGVLPDIVSDLVMPARYLKVEIRGSGVLTLCEVEVYGREISYPVEGQGVFYKRENMKVFPPIKETHFLSVETHCAVYCSQKEFCQAYGVKKVDGGMFECQLTEVIAAIGEPGWSFHSPCQLPV